MEMPKPGAEHQRLQKLAGTWSGEETMHPGTWTPTAMHAQGRVVAKLELGGFFLISKYEQRMGTQLTFEGRGIYGWDPQKKRYTMHWFDTMGNDPGAPALGAWEGSKLVFENEHAMGRGRYVYELLADGRYTFHMEMSRDGKSWTPIMDATYRRES